MRRGPILLCLLLSAWAPDAWAERRIAVVLGNNFGHAEEVVLRFAQQDAKRVAQVLTELAGVKKQDLFLLLDQDRDAVERAFADANRLAQGNDAVLIFYYSGHADETSLHLGDSELSWSALRQHLEGTAAGLRIALVDACQSGALTQRKGFSLGPRIGPAPSQSRGTAVFVSAESSEAAQESVDLGGSFFTHFLVSALRGAGDANGDGRITLAEAHSYTTGHTRRATSAWAQSVQRPVYEFDITGHGEIVLTDLREAAARLSLAPELGGRVVVTERGSPQVLLETQKRPGESLALALPTGRYVVHLRDDRSVSIAEVLLPWGGEVSLSESDLTATSYQAVAQKGGVLQTYRHRLRAGAGVQSALVTGMGPVFGGRVGYGFRLGVLELGLRGLFLSRSFSAVDTAIDTRIIGGGLFAAYEYALSIVDLRFWLVGEGQYWRQDVAKEGVRESSLFGVGVGVGVRIPLFLRLFSELSLESMAYFPELASGRAVRATLGGAIEIGVLL